MPRLPQRIRIVEDVPVKAVLVCAARGHFADDVHARCDSCGAPIMHRPAVAHVERKICMSCWQAGAAGPPDGKVAEISAASLREIALHMSTPKGRA